MGFAGIKEKREPTFSKSRCMSMSQVQDGGFKMGAGASEQGMKEVIKIRIFDQKRSQNSVFI